MNELPPHWRSWTVKQLQDFLRYTLRVGHRDSPYFWPYMGFRTREQLIEWIEKNVDRGNCPTCLRPY